MQHILNSIRPFLLFALGALALVVAAMQADRVAAQSGPSKIVLVRHAEIGTTPNDEFGPLLNEAGRRRAQVLAAMMRNEGVTLILTSKFRRTRETAQPTAAALGLTPRLIVDDDVDAHVESHLEALRGVRNGAVLVVGHSDSVAGLILKLGGPRLQNLCGDTFDRMFVLAQPPGAPLQLTRARYGDPTPGGADCP